MKELAELNAIYQKMSTPDIDEAMIVTNADKKGNTPAYQNFKKGMKKKDGTPMYKAADHMKEEEIIDEKMNAGLRAYLDKKMKGKKNGDKEENGNGNGNGKASKGSKPDFLDLDKDGNKTEPMKSAAKSKKEETEYNYVNQYIEMAAPRMQKGAMAYDGPNKAASEAKDRVMAKAKRKKPTVTIDKPDSLVSMKVSKGYKESFDKLVESGKFSDLELQRIIFDDFEENYRAMRNPEKYKPDDESDKPYRERSREARMKDPKRGINSPAFKKFMADRGM